MFQLVSRLFVTVLTLTFAPLVVAQDDSGSSAVILQYHHVSTATPRVTSVNTDEFRAHLEYLRNNDFTILPLEEIVAALRSGDALPDRTAADSPVTPTPSEARA